MLKVVIIYINSKSTVINKRRSYKKCNFGTPPPVHVCLHIGLGLLLNRLYGIILCRIAGIWNILPTSYPSPSSDLLYVCLVYLFGICLFGIRLFGDRRIWSTCPRTNADRWTRVHVLCVRCVTYMYGYKRTCVLSRTSVIINQSANRRVCGENLRFRILFLFFNTNNKHDQSIDQSINQSNIQSTNFCRSDRREKIALKVSLRLCRRDKSNRKQQTRVCCFLCAYVQQ